jgi:type IV pilus assembly protein PilB
VLGYTPADVAPYEFRKGAGCPRCHHTGYKGRAAVIEMLILNEHVRDAMIARKSSYDIRKISIQTSGLVTLFEDAVFKAAKGITTIEEVFRCVPRQLLPRSISEIKRLQGA